MAVSQPTRNAAFFLRRTDHGSEDYLRFDTRKALARDLVNRCSFQRSTGAAVVMIFGGGDTFLQLQVQSNIQTSHTKWGAVWDFRCESLVCLEAFSPNGRPLNLRGLLELGEDPSTRWARYASRGLVYCGYGPVPNIRKSRGGSGYFRRMHTISDRRMNALVVVEDGEVPARMARTGRNLPNDWDDDSFGRRSRGWKAQRKSRKAWG